MLRRSVTVRGDLIAVGGAAVLVALGTALGIHFNRPGSGVVIFAFAPPLYGDWLPRVGPGSLFAVLLAAAVVMWGRRWPSGSRGGRCSRSATA